MEKAASSNRRCRSRVELPRLSFHYAAGHAARNRHRHRERAAYIRTGGCSGDTWTEDAEGELCDTCISSLRGDTGTGHGLVPTGRHHTNHREFVASKDSSCFICTWLWMKHVPPPETKDNREVGVEEYPSATEFRIELLPFSFRDQFDIAFRIVCSWTDVLTLCGISYRPPLHLAVTRY